ncbi:MAG: addiction module killer protein [Gammaproteobacteria bacterium RIFCSPHIGHO2_12_FULL_36_30]|nr:MAG: addiction module killer protein [Gammaproteobacteria bacterium RIFCSPHIGHO2_12_FULL_36_30]
MKILRYYQTSSGKEPFQEWLEKLKDSVAVLQITKRVRRLILGNRGDSASVGEGVFELRIHIGPGYRVYYAEQGKELVILLFGGDKGSQQRDIDKAIAYWKDYLGRYYEKN